MDLGSWLIVLDRAHVDGEDLSCRIGRGLRGSGANNCTAIGFGATEARRKIHHDGVLRIRTITELVPRRKAYCGSNEALDPPIGPAPSHVGAVRAGGIF
jgi:hypothetical protein